MTAAISRTNGRPTAETWPAHERHDAAIAVRGLSKRFGAFRAVDDVSFKVPSGQLVALLGPSGSGKSTILRIIAGLEAPDAGEVVLTGEDATTVPVQRRGVGFVFQHYALFRHMTVRQNVVFGLEVRGADRREVRGRVERLLHLVQLHGYADRYPSQLSGGQRQRVALARALAPEPKVLLLDEPFGALDAKVREELRTWLRSLHDEAHVTSLFVTHDQQEAFEVADRVVVLNQGKVEQIGPPQDLYESPASPFVAEFLGAINVLPVDLIRALGYEAMEATSPDDPAASAYIRPHDLDIDRRRNGRPSWPARVSRLVPLGPLVRLELTLIDGTTLRVLLTRDRHYDLALAAGEDVFVAPRNLRLFRESGPIIEDAII
ncbi:MAG TPA: sulfate/molybdate ABC transporter ATP-binding protein [Isosphaeraceae bacterium]|jgi:sulfate transport system ATP-binding protein|nr:sulfate/molybdate ABC transporter ATP-binding protein [Isosphaeraceae bacterium]